MTALPLIWKLLTSRLGLVSLALLAAFAAHQIDKRLAVAEARRAGVDACEAAHREAVEALNRQIEVLADQANAAAVDLVIAMQERAEIERMLEDEARHDLDLGALGPDRLRRLGAIR